MPKKPKIKFTYTVPVIHHCTFSAEVQVEAFNLKEARKLALTETVDGYDWNRFQLKRVSIAKK